MNYPNATHASEHFTWRELQCKCGKCRMPAGVKANLARLAAELEKLRAALGGVAVLITSAYRCPACNRAVGGAPKSQHMDGIAVDLATRQYTPAQVKAAAEKIPAFANGGIGIYPSWVHVDIRGYKARW